MRVVYLSNAQIPSRSTNALQIMRMCEGFRRAGCDVTLVHPYRIGNRPEGYDGDVWSFYGVKDRFQTLTLPTLLTRGLADIPWVARPVQAVPLGAFLVRRCRPSRTPFVCYARSSLGAWLALHVRGFWGDRSACRGVFVEVHDEPRTARDWTLLAQANGVFTISAALRDRLVERRAELEGHTWVEHDGVDLELVDPNRLDRLEARRRLGLPQEGSVVVYTGRVNSAKGADVILDAALLLQRIRAQLVLVGKVYDPAYEEQAVRLGNVTLTGFVAPFRVPDYLAAADILVLPSTRNLPYAPFTSPLKLFEYMASGRPIVASDLPVFREVLTDGRNALFYPSSDPTSLASAVQLLWEDPELRSRLARQARTDAVAHSWERRAERIMNRIKSDLG